MRNIVLKYYQRLRIKLFRWLSSTDITIKGWPILYQPVQFVGKGSVCFGTNVNLGVIASPYYFDGTTYIECREQTALVEFGSDISINNNLKIICDRSLVKIDDGVLMGYNVHLIDSDFHNILPDKRLSGDYKFAPIHIKKNVFIGSNVTILKGVTIGENSVIANGAIVTKSFPDNVIIGGNPARIIKEINESII